ncbi:HNH endonuclease [Priestia sp. TRN 1309]|uniref:HNH endonuclease n=1 Tax=Priestia sp. TRN 1309 TaxID=3420729 RepID=UPI003D76D3C0
MTNQITCIYCKELKPQTTTIGEHVIPEALGSPIATKLVCDECNKDANEFIDVKYSSNTHLMQALLRVTGTQTKSGHLAPKEQKTAFDQDIKIVFDDGEVYFTNLTEKKLTRLEERFKKKDFLALDLRVKNEDVLKREHAKIILGLCSICLLNFTNTKTADFLRQYIWGADKSLSSKFTGEKQPQYNFLIYTRGKNFQVNHDDFSEIMNSNNFHGFRVETLQDGSYRIYLHIYSVFDAYLIPLEKNMNWNDVKIMINPTNQTITKCEGVAEQALLP